jgi:hypothetical protein
VIAKNSPQQEAVGAQTQHRDRRGEREREHRGDRAGDEHALGHLPLEDQELRREPGDGGEGDPAHHGLASEHTLEEMAGGFVHAGTLLLPGGGFDSASFLESAYPPETESGSKMSLASVPV